MLASIFLLANAIRLPERSKNVNRILRVAFGRPEHERC